jgi:2-oxo-4-hydroxy-4-carboxy-5-ureidoimidazoline decarboxylase
MPNLAELNELDRAAFTCVVGPLFEHSPWVAKRTWTQRPFASAPALHHALCVTVQTASPDEQLALIRAHPDLVTRALLTSESEDEQTSAGLLNISPEEARQFQEYNAQYRERFGFPFVICARLNKKEAILRAFPVRLRRDLESEIKTALDEIGKIAELRLQDLIK